MELEEICTFKLELAKVLKVINESRGKLETTHLRKNPLYACYFCEGYNYNCRDYKQGCEVEKKYAVLNNGN